MSAQVPGTVHRPIVTLAALYGAGGSVIGPQVAQRLGVPLLDREVPAAVAKSMGLPEEALADDDEQPRSPLDRAMQVLGRASTSVSASYGVERLDLQERQIRGNIEKFLADSSVTGGVAVGRGGAVVLRSVPWALHVYLGGPQDRRIEQRMRLEGIDRRTAEHRQELADRMRIGYVQRAYGVDGRDPSLYHFMIDSTALDLDTCVDVIVAASLARIRAATATPTASPRR